MIVVYPMLISQAVSENIVPGIARTLENYILVHYKDMIIDNSEVKRNFNFKVKAGKLFMKENVDLSEDGTDDWQKGKKKQPKKDEDVRSDIHAQQQKNKKEFDRDEVERQKLQQAKDREETRKKEREEDRLEREREKEKEKIKQDKIDAAKRASVNIKMSDSKALSIEPTTIDVEVTDIYGNLRKESFGVKVISLRVKSDEKLSRLILHDTQISNLTASFLSIGRKVMRLTYKLVDRWSNKLGSLIPSGDPRRDIIMGRSGHKGEGFIVLSKTEDIDDIFLQNTKKLNRLFKMGWGNIIIVDDINRMAYFCMKKFKGICTAISYPMIYQNFGQLKVYETLEDAKRQSSSLFKIRKPLSKVLAEWVVEYRQVKYLNEGK